MCFILLVMGIYNYEFVKWFDEKLKLFFINCFIIIDIFVFVIEMKEMKLNEEDIFVLFDVLFLFINVFLDEIIIIFVKKVFIENWFNEIYDLNIKEFDLVIFL